MISTPFGSPCCKLAIFVLIASIVSSAFLPARMTMTPPTTSPLPSNSEIPRRISGPIWIRATSPKRMGVPPAPKPTGTLRKSSRFLRYPVARTAYSASPSSSTEPPVSLFESRSADFTLSMVMPKRPHTVRVEHDLVLLDQAADAGDFGDIRHALQFVP